MAEPTILIANPGSASRKYALYVGDKQAASIHFEVEDNQVVYSYNSGKTQPAGISHVTFASSKIAEILELNGHNIADVDAVGVRIVAPSAYFQKSRILDSAAREHLAKLQITAPIHIDATMQEVHLLERFMPHKKLVGISDSAFHTTMPSHAKLYGISQSDANKLGIQRYGYHGLSVQSAIRSLDDYHSIPDNLIVCHLGSGSSITAVKEGKSIDTSMGYSPLEGLVMSTRSGSIDPTAVQALKTGLKLTPSDVQEYLNHKSGLLGLSGLSADIRELLQLEKEGNDDAKLALQMYVYHIQQGIGQMAASLGGIDAVIFTGTVGERSNILRSRICKPLHFLGIDVDTKRNLAAKHSDGIRRISHSGAPVAVYIIATDEMGEMAIQTRNLLS